MRFDSDPFGNPTVICPESGLEILLFPVLRTQFDRFLCEPGRQADEVTEELDQVSVRRPYLSLSAPQDALGLVAQGVTFEEARSYCAWMAGGWRLPAPSEWQRAFGEIDGKTVEPGHPGTSLAASDPASAAILRAHAAAASPPELGTLSMMREGVFEWVELGGEAFFCGNSLHHGGFDDPRTSRRRALSTVERLGGIGFRPFRSIPESERRR